MAEPGVAHPDALHQVYGVGEGDEAGDHLERRREYSYRDEQATEAEHRVENKCADGLGEAGGGDDAGYEKADGEDAEGADEESDCE